MAVRAFKPADAGPLASGQLVILDDEERHYLAKVRRVRTGDLIELNDLEGQWWQAHVENLSGRDAMVRVGSPVRDLPTPSPTALLLGLPDPKTVLDLLPGVCELAVTHIVFVRCARSQTDGPGTRRVERVLRAAMRQCGRPTAPAVVGPLSVAEAVQSHPDWASFVAVAGTRACSPPLRLDPSRAQRGVSVLVGPEGGLVPEEIQAATQAGFSPVGLGPWVLRTQTAACALLAQVLGQR